MTSCIDDATATRLLRFLQAYQPAINSELQRRDTPYLVHHRDANDLVATFLCSDGAATFYLRPPHDAGIERGFPIFDYRAFTLNQVCQSLHINRLQVVVPELNVACTEPIEMIADVERIPELSMPWFDDEVRRAAIERRIDSLPGMSITPIVHIEGGIRRSITPGRMKLWSPLIEIPNTGLRRLFLWTHADFWWEPNGLNVDSATATTVAAQDAVALEALLTAQPILRPETAQCDAASSASDILDRYCAELATLIDDPSTSEEVLHQWLADERHRVFIDPHATKIWSKLPFGDSVSDFVVQTSDGSYTLIEIERASALIMQRGNQEPTAPFNHACQQVRDWRRYIRDNMQTVRHELGLHDIYEPRGKVIIGRDSHIESPDAARRWRDLRQSGDLTLLTYDQVVASVKQLASSLRTLLHGTAC